MCGYHDSRIKRINNITYCFCIKRETTFRLFRHRFVQCIQILGKSKLEQEHFTLMAPIQAIQTQIPFSEMLHRSATKRMFDNLCFFVIPDVPFPLSLCVNSRGNVCYLSGLQHHRANPIKFSSIRSRNAVPTTNDTVFESQMQNRYDFETNNLQKLLFWMKRSVFVRFAMFINVYSHSNNLFPQTCKIDFYHRDRHNQTPWLKCLSSLIPRARISQSALSRSDCLSNASVVMGLLALVPSGMKILSAFGFRLIL